jgi:transposase
MPERYGPYTTAYNRFNRWRKDGIWDRLMDAIVKAHDGDVQMIDSSARASACLRSQKKWRSLCGAMPRRLTTKIHARVDAQGRPVQLPASPGNDHDVTHAEPLLEGIEECRSDCRQGIRRRRCPCMYPRSRRDPQHSQPLRPENHVSLEEGALSPAQSCRALLQQDKAVSAGCHAIRQARRQLLRFHQASRRANLAAIN